MDPATWPQPERPGGEIVGPNPAISFNSTYYEGQRVQYGRYSNSTWEAFERLVGGLEGGEAVVFASGQAAFFAVAVSLASTLAVAEDCYVGTRELAERVAQKGIARLRWLASAELERPAELSGLGEGDLVHLESPSNPLLKLYPLAELARACSARGALLSVDNTVATPVLQNPLRLGADVVVHSATKYISGHSDVLAGVVVARDPSLVAKVKEARSLFGAVVGPAEAYLCYRGTRTLGVRVEHVSRTAAELAARLAARLGREAVLYPGLSAGLAGPGGQQRLGGGLISILLGSMAEAEALLAPLSVFQHATSFGGVESLAERRAKYPGEERVPPGLVRLSVGLEAVEDLWADLASGLEAAGL